MKPCQLLRLATLWMVPLVTTAQTPAATPAPPIAVTVSAKTAPAKTAAAAVGEPERNIRFQFEGIPYSDVVERFAQMAGKPLLSDTNIVGSLTYDDPHAYNYTEALDTLNVMLGMKGAMLVEDGNNLRLVPFKQLPSMPLKILRGLDASSDVRPGEVVTVVLDVNNLDAKEVADSVLPMLSTAGSVAPLSRGRGLVVTDRLANIQRVRTLLATIGSGQTAERQMKTYTLQHASGGIVADLLNRTFGLSTAPKRTTFNPSTKTMEVLPPDPNDYITAVYDEASRVMVLFGPNERLVLADELISKFEQKDGGGGDVRIYHPQTIKAEELANMIRQAIPGVAAANEPATTSSTKARVIADSTQNRLIVAAPLPGQLDQIEQLVTRVDKGIVGAVGLNGENGLVPNRSQTVQLTKIFRPRATGATNVASIVRQALTRRGNGGQPTTTASVSYDAGSQSVVVTGSPGDVQTATEIVSQLETGTAQPTSLQTRFIDVGSPEEARRIQPLVEQLYQNQSADGSASTVAHAKILADTESGRLIVTASEEHLSRIETLVHQLRADKPQAQARHLKVIPLKNTRTETSLSPIQSLVSERMADRRFNTLPKPSVVADAPNNRLLVTATDEQLKEIDEVVAVVDVLPSQSQRDLSVIALQAKTAAEIIPLVSQLATQLTGPGQLAPTLMADPTGKQIIVLAGARETERIRTLVKQFDVSAATAAPRQFRGIELHGRTAVDFTPLVQQLYQEQIRSQPEPAGGPATLIAETKNNRIMVSGGAAEIARVEAIIRQLDPLDRKPQQDETRVIRLKTASAPDLLGLIEKSLNAQTQQIRVMVDARSNSLVVTGEHAAVEAAWQLIQELDTRDGGGARELRLIELKSADATTLAPTLTGYFADTLKELRGPNYVTTTKIIPDPLANRLVVTGSHEDIEQIVALVSKFDNTPQQAPGARVFKLTMAEAAMMAPIVSNAMLRFDARGQAQRRVTVTADEKSNSLIVSGTRTDLQDAESVIEKLDGESTQKERVLRVFEVKGDADALAALVQKVFAAQNPGRNLNSLLSITPEPAGKRILVLAPPAMQVQMETVLATLDAKPDQGIRELHAVDLKNGTATDLMPKVTQIYTEQSQGKTLKPATIYPDASGARLLVQGTAEQAASIQQIVDTVASQSRAAREVKVFDLGKLTEAVRVLPLAQQLYKDQLGSNPQLGSADAQMVSDGKTGRVFVTARADQMKTIEEIVKQLQVNSGAAQPERVTRTLEVGTAADVQRILPLLLQLYTDHWKDRQESDPADAQIIGDPRTGRVIVSGKPEHLKQIEAFLQQLGGGKAKTESRQTRVIDLTTASAVELATTVRTLYTEEAKGRLGGQPPDALITPDTGGNRLILVGETNELTAIEDIIHKLDKGSAQSSSARVFKIKSADPDKVAEILTSSLVRYDAYGRPQKRATVSVDAKTRTLIVTGDPKELQGVSLIIEQLDQSLGAQPERKTRVITLKQGKAVSLSSKVRQLYADRVKSQPELSTSDLLILEEIESNQLIVSGNDAQLQLVDQLVSELQSAQVVRAARETKLLDVGSLDELTRLQPLVQQLYLDRVKGRDTSDPADAKIISDPQNARFIVTGRSNHIAEIEGILAQLRGRDSQFVARETRIFDLTTASAVELSGTVKTLYLEQAKNRPGAPSADTLITPDTGGNRIIVTGSTNELAAVEDLIRKLDKVGVQSASTRVFKLKSADPDKVVEILATALVRYDAYGRPQKRVSVVTDAKTRTIIATGDPKELQSASVIIEQLDTSLGTPGGRSMRVLTAKNRSATELGSKVRQVFLDRSKSQPDLSGTEALILEDVPSNQLIVAGTEAQLIAIEEIAVLLQAGTPETGRTVRVIPLERNTATGLTTMLSQLYAKQIASTDPSQRLLVSIGGNERTLVVDAPAEMVTKIEELVKSLDQTDANNQNVIQTVRLTKSRAEDLAEAVNRTLTNRLSPGGGRRVNVTPVAGANSLLINGPTNVVQDVMRIIRELDLEGNGAGDIEVRIYKLENGTAREASAILQQLLQNVTRNLRGGGPGDGGEGTGGGRRVPPASVSVDERSNSLIISATAAHFRVVEKILPTLDKVPERADRDVQFIWLRKAKAYDVSSKLETLFEDRPRAERPVIEPDITGNSLTVIARKGDLVQIQDLIGRLDEQSRDSAVQVRLRPLERVGAEEMARMLENIYPQMSGTPLRVTDKVTPPPLGTNNPVLAPEVVIAVDKAANALVLSGPAQELDNVEHLVSELSLRFSGSESEFRLFPIKDADPVVVARTLTELLRQEAVAIPVQPGQPPQAVQPRQRITVVAEPRTRSVIVRGRPTDFTLMESLIRQLDNAGQISQLEFRVVTLTNSTPSKLLPVVLQMVTQLSATRPGEPVTVAADPRTRGLVVIARDVMAAQVEKMIRSLDVPAENVEAEVRIVALKKANAAQLATVLQNLLKPAAAGETTVESRELQEQIRRLQVSNGSGTNVVLDLTRPIRIAPDPTAGTGGGNRIILTSTPDNVAALVAIVELMDTVPLLEGVNVRFHHLDFADATAVSQTLINIFTQGRSLAVGPAGPGGEPAEQGKALVSPLNVAVDSRSNTLILSGREESLELALKMVKDLDQEMDRFVTDVRLFRLKYASAARLVPLLQAAFAEGTSVPGSEGLSTQITRLRTLRDGEKPRMNETPKTRAALTVQADEQSNIIIVAARSDNLPLVADVIDQLDIPSASGLETVRVYPLVHADPAAVQKVLTDLYSGPRSASLRTEDKPIITVDGRTGSLIVAGNAKAFGIIDSLLAQLDQKLPFDLRDIALFPLEHADANVVAPTLQKLMDARVTQRASLNQGQADALKVIIMSDQRSNALLIGGSREAFELVQTLAKQLDQASPALSGRVRLIPMQFADARVLAGTLTTLFEQRYAALRTAEGQRNKPVILADTRSNALLVAANQEDNGALDELLSRLDARQENPALTLTVLSLKHNDSAKVATLVESIFAARLKAQVLPGQAPLPSEQIKVEADPLNNSLIVSASKENLELIRTLLDQLDQEPVIADGVFELFTLQFADAQRVSTILKSLVDQGLYRPGRVGGAAARSNTGRDVLSVTVDPRSNTLIVSASPENLVIVREVIKRIDTRDMAANADVRLYNLKNARASSLAATLTQFFQAKQRADAIAVNANQRSVPATVIADDRVNSLLVTGGREAFDLVDRLLPQLDGDGQFSLLNFRVFPLKKATAAKLRATLQPIFANRPPKVRGEPIDPITIVADPWVNALLVGAAVDDMSTVASLIERLDSDPSETGLAIHVFPLAKADARKVATTVQGLFRENLPNQVLPINVTPDERINAIVVSCGEADARRIGELVRKLDTDQVARVSEIKVFPLRYARAEALSAILNTALNTRPTAVNEQSPTAQSVLQFITRSEQGQELVTAALKEGVLITPDPRMNSLIVSGPVDYMGLLEQIIARLDASSPQLAKIKVFALKNGDARQMADVLTQMFRMTQTASTAGNQRSIQYTLMRSSADADDQAMGSVTLGTAEQSALTVTVDPRTNSLLVGGTDHYVDLVSQLIDSLDSSVGHERNSEVIRLRNSQATDVATAIRGFLDQERQKIIQAMGPDAGAAVARTFEQEVAVVAEQSSNTLLLSANRRYFEEIRNIIAELDEAQPQVLIQVLLAEVTLDSATDLGMEWTHSGTVDGNKFGAGTDFGVPTQIQNFGGFSSTVTGNDFNFVLRALKEQGRLEVLSRPQIVTGDNKPATINIGQRVPLLDQSRLDTLNNLTTSYRYEDVGVNLTVTPKISANGFVKMEIGTTNSAISSASSTITSKGTTAPVYIINQRKANTTVSAQSGQTILIGGLIATTDDKRVKKMPVLGDIPYVGAFFRSTSVKHDRKELLILMTPQVMYNATNGIAGRQLMPLRNPDDILREEANATSIGELKKRGELQSRLLSPAFPTNTPTRRERFSSRIKSQWLP